PISEAQRLFNVAFIVVLVSLLLQGFTIAPAARLLKVEVPPEPTPFLRHALELPTKREYEIFVFHLDERTHCTNIAIRDLGMPIGTRIAALFRDESLIFPKGETVDRSA